MQANAKCPVCGTDLSDAVPDFCPTCSWECGIDLTLFPSLTHHTKRDLDYYQRKLAQARECWTKKQDEISKLDKAKADLEKNLKEARNRSGANKQKSAVLKRKSRQNKQKPVDINHATPHITLEPEMVFVEGGSFVMGSDKWCPAHTVSLSSFYIGKYTLTQAQCPLSMDWIKTGPIGVMFPLHTISWYRALAICNLLSVRDGFAKCYNFEDYKGISGESLVLGGGYYPYYLVVECDFNALGYRLPTEAEWEYAARGGSRSEGFEYSGSHDLGLVAWYRSNSGGQPHPVGGKKANELGLFDMLGNVNEWCWDAYAHYVSKPQIDPTGPPRGKLRMKRGGSYQSVAKLFHVCKRSWAVPECGDDSYGLRICRSA